MLHGSHFDCAKMLIESRSHQLGKGQSSSAEMPCVPHPSRPVYGSQRVSAEMSHCTHSHQLGEGHQCGAAMPMCHHPSRSVHRGHQNNAAMPFLSRLAREGSVNKNRNVRRSTPFPTSLWAVLETQKCHVTDAHQFMGGSEETHSNVTGIALSHQLGKDIICTLIKPLLFLPFLLIYGSQLNYAEMPI